MDYATILADITAGFGDLASSTWSFFKDIIFAPFFFVPVLGIIAAFGLWRLVKRLLRSHIK